MRASDQEKEHRSYIVVWDTLTQKFKVKGEFWNPGYTKAHQATPEAAVQYELQKVSEQKNDLTRKASALYKLGSDLEKENDE